MQFTGIVPALHLSSDMLSVATSLVQRDGEDVSKSYHVYLYGCHGGQLEEMEVRWTRNAPV